MRNRKNMFSFSIENILQIDCTKKAVLFVTVENVQCLIFCLFALAFCCKYIYMRMVMELSFYEEAFYYETFYTFYHLECYRRRIEIINCGEITE